MELIALFSELNAMHSVSYKESDFKTLFTVMDCVALPCLVGCVVHLSIDPSMIMWLCQFRSGENQAYEF